MAEFPKITNDKLFMLKICEALVMATDFQIGSGAIIVNDGLVRIPNIVGDYAVEIEFVKNQGTNMASYRQIKNVNNGTDFANDITDNGKL